MADSPRAIPDVPEMEAALAIIKRDAADEKAWSTVFQGLWGSIYALAHWRLHGDPDTASDIAQQAFVRLAQRWKSLSFESITDVRAYLRASVLSAVIDHVRAAHTRENFVSAESNRSEGGSAPDTERGIDLQRALLSLPDAERSLLVMALEGYEITEIAGRLDITYAAAAMRLSRARQALRKSLEDRRLAK